MKVSGTRRKYKKSNKISAKLSTKIRKQTYSTKPSSNPSKLLSRLIKQKMTPANMATFLTASSRFSRKTSLKTTLLLRIFSPLERSLINSIPTLNTSAKIITIT